MSSQDTTGAAGLAEVTADRRRLANVVLWVGFGAITAVAGLSIWTAFRAGAEGGATDQQQLMLVLSHVDKVLAQIVPLFAAWVGTIIAFYFARENFDAATQNARVLLRDMQPDRLAAIKVRDKMIPYDKLIKVEVNAAQDNTVNLQAELQRIVAARVSRMIILDAARHGRGVLHDSTVLEFMLKNDLHPGKTADQVTLADMLAVAEYNTIFDATTAYVPITATLADVKAAMERRSQGAPLPCRDVLVTETGRADAPVVGYIANLDLEKHAAYGGG